MYWSIEVHSNIDLNALLYKLIVRYWITTILCSIYDVCFYIAINDSTILLSCGTAFMHVMGTNKYSEMEGELETKFQN